jgi:hypothetical protein
MAVEYLTEQEVIDLYQTFIGKATLRDRGGFLLRSIGRCSQHSAGTPTRRYFSKPPH